MIKNEEMLRTFAPAAFADSPEDGRVSSRYSFLPTTEILPILQDEGWTAWRAQQVNSRSWSRGHAKHIIRLRHDDLGAESFGVGDSFPEMLLINAHNGLGGYTLQGGIFRMVCSNGMVVSENDFGKIHIRHIGFNPQQVKDASRELVVKATGLAEKINTWKTIELSTRTRKDFFVDAAKVRFTNPSDSIIREVGRIRREEDNGNDLWSVFNVAQENIMRGGYLNEDTRRRVRPIQNIQKDVNFNSQLWDLASTYSESFSV